MSINETSECFNLSSVKHDSERGLALLRPGSDDASFLDLICYDESCEYTDYFAFVKDLPNEILVSIFAQLCFKDLCMVERGTWTFLFLLKRFAY